MNAIAFHQRLQRWQRLALVAGLCSLALCGLGAVAHRPQFYCSYLFASLFWLGLTLGCFLVALLHSLTGGRWGYPVRRFLEAGFGVMPLMLLLFLPLFFGLRELYPWARPEAVAANPVLQHQRAYMNETAYIVRTLFFLSLWTGMAWLLRRWSLQQDATSEATPTRKLRALSGAGMVLVPLTATFGCVDWVMSSEVGWYSTMFAVIVLIGQILLAYAFVIVLLVVCRHSPPWATIVTARHYHDLGNLLLAFVLFWTYVSFGQWLVIYSGNLPRETSWYRHRIEGGWLYVVGMLVAFHFSLPFLLLLFRSVKRHATALAGIALTLLLAHIVQVYWLVLPSFHAHGVRLHWLDGAAWLGLGGLWVSVFIRNLKSAPLLPQQDPGAQFAVSYAHAT